MHQITKITDPPLPYLGTPVVRITAENEDASANHIGRRHQGKRAGGCREIAVGGGVPVWVRTLQPADRNALAGAFERLSERSRTQRFLGPKKQLTDHDLTRLSDVDHVRREAVAAIDPADGSIIGVARYCTWPGRDRVAEVAGEVVDDWQGRGIGGELLARIIERADANAIRKLTASALSDNATALALLRRAGFTTNRQGYGVTELQLQLRQTNPATHAFAAEPAPPRRRSAL
jgi:RimJ/RimL family protein N-acetyltransferase